MKSHHRIGRRVILHEKREGGGGEYTVNEIGKMTYCGCCALLFRGGTRGSTTTSNDGKEENNKNNESCEKSGNTSATSSFRSSFRGSIMRKSSGSSRASNEKSKILIPIS